MQLEIECDTFIQRDIPVDGSIFQIDTTGLDMSIVDATDVDVANVSCQAFADVAAKTTVGGPATSASDAILTTDRNHPATINAIICSTLVGLSARVRNGG